MSGRRAAAMTSALALGLIGGAGAPARAQQGSADPAAIVELQAPASCETGARCEVAVLARSPDGARCTLEPPGRLGAFEVLQVVDAGPTTGTERRWRLSLVAFDPGTQLLPPLAVRAVSGRDGSVALVSSTSTSIDVKLPEAAPGDRLRDAPGPIDPGLDWRVVAAWILAGVAVVSGLECLRRVRRRSRAQPQQRARYPTVDSVVASLRALERQPVSSPDDVLGIYRRMSDELRRFFRAGLALPAEALSSQELVQALSSTPAGPAHASRGRSLLERVDRVKFGRDRPDREARREAIAQAVGLVTAIGLPKPRSPRAERDVA